MPTPTYTPLATVTLASSASSVSFSNIPATYRDLILVYEGTMTGASGIGVQFNGDTGSNYSEVNALARGQGTTTSSSGTSTALFGDYYDTAARVIKIVQIMDYSATDKHKTALCRINSASSTTTNTTPAGMYAGRWANTAAITSVLINAGGSTFQTGATFSLYGVIS